MYYVNSLFHLCEDVKHFRCKLSEISAFQFENHLQTLKKLVRNTQNPIAQVVKRVSELDQSCMTRRRHGNLNNRIATRWEDSCFLVGNEEIAFV